MEREDITVGMMVVPHSKSVFSYGDLESSVNWQHAIKINQPYLFVSNIYPDYIVLDSIKESNGGDYFLPEDFEQYIESNANQENNNESRNIKMKKSDLNSSMLFKMRDGDLCVLLSDVEGNEIFYNKEDIQQGYSDYGVSITDYDEDLTPEDEAYDIVAIKQRNTCVRVIADVLEDEEPKEWDWVEEVEKVEEPEVENVVQNITNNITIDSSNKDSSQFRELINGLSKYATQYSKT